MKPKNVLPRAKTKNYQKYLGVGTLFSKGFWPPEAKKTLRFYLKSYINVCTE
jgi:hypothetical protein